MKNKREENKRGYDLISVSGVFYPMTGGLEVVAYNFLNYLTNRGYKVIAVHGRGEGDKTYTLNNYTVRTFKTRNLFNNTYPIFSFNFFFYICKLIKNNPKAKIIVHSRHFTCSFLTALACSFLRRDLILLEQTAQTSFLKSKWAQCIVYIYERIFSQFVLKKAKTIISSSQASVDYLTKKHRISTDKINIVNNGVDLKDLNKYLSFTKEKKKSVLFATKMIKVKNPEVTYKAFVDLAEKYPEWDFHFIGDGDFFEGEPTKNKNLKITKKTIKREDFLKLAASSTIFVNSSLSEGLSLAIVEATYLKNIPVISNAPSNVEIAERLNTKKYIFEKHNVEDLKSKLQLAMKEYGDQRLLSNIQEATRKNFNNDDIFKKYENLMFRE